MAEIKKVHSFWVVYCEDTGDFLYTCESKREAQTYADILNMEM